MWWEFDQAWLKKSLKCRGVAQGVAKGWKCVQLFWTVAWQQSTHFSSLNYTEMVVILGLIPLIWQIILYYQCRRLFNIQFFSPVVSFAKEMNPLEINENLLPPTPRHRSVLFGTARCQKFSQRTLQWRDAQFARSRAWMEESVFMWKARRSRLIFVNSWNPPATILNDSNVKAA